MKYVRTCLFLCPVLVACVSSAPKKVSKAEPDGQSVAGNEQSEGQEDPTAKEELGGRSVEVNEYTGAVARRITAGPGRSKVDSRSQVSLTFGEKERDVSEALNGLKEINRLLEDHLERLDLEYREILKAERARDSLLRGGLTDGDREDLRSRDVRAKQRLSEASDRVRRQYVHLDAKDVEALAAGTRALEVEVRAQKADGTPLHVFNWTEGQPPSAKGDSVLAQIEREVERAKANREAAEEKEERNRTEMERMDEMPDVQDDADTDGAAEANPPAVGEVPAVADEGESDPGDGIPKSMRDGQGEVAATDDNAMIDSLTGVDRQKAMGDDMSQSAGELTSNLQHVRRSLDGFLPHGRLELGLADAERGDKLDLEVNLIRPGKEGEPDQTVDQLEYLMELDDFGWRGKVRPQLIFFRSTDGDAAAKQFRTNAAALVDWSYRYRDPEGGWGKFVNGFEPSLGIHVASVDQGESSLEVGTGFNLSFKQGLVSVGWGYNLSERDHYYFIGGNLFRLIDVISGSE